MSDETSRRIANENAEFLGAIGEMFNLITETTPSEDRELFRAAVQELQPDIQEAQETLRSGAVDEEIARVKPPALWELEKKMFNEAAREAGTSEIPDLD